MKEGGVRSRVAIQPERIDPAALLAEVANPEAGAVVLFLGTARNHSEGKLGITHLEYEAYSEAVVAKIEELVAQAGSKWQLMTTVVEHRVGDVAVGQPSVAVAVAAVHRDAAFEAGRFLIDELKAKAPIWKKEHWPGGGEWVAGA
ncbi:MAG TPA: molybdenum cofactor biosynthesis protein MoaE [Acidimicrobiia bacterium]|nr:molybdenum cofactor biosynthesis protein MoaE [Acidimicrobiia bacterium]